MDKCSVCGSKKEIVTISSYLGGYVCKKCHRNEPLVDVKTIGLRAFYNIPNVITIYFNSFSIMMIDSSCSPIISTDIFVTIVEKTSLQDEASS